MILSRRIILIIILLLCGLFCKAQGIKNQLRQQQQKQQNEQRQRENELKEQARKNRAFLNLKDLEAILEMSDLEDIDIFLTEREWVLKTTDLYDKSFDKLSRVTWVFNQNKWDEELASGWFYFYTYPVNTIMYGIAEEPQVAKIKSSLNSMSYKRYYPTDAVETGIESVFRNDKYEISFGKKAKDYNDKGADIQYYVEIFNYKQRDAILAEAERILREAAELEEKYKDAINRGEQAYIAKNYSAAKQAYNEAIALKPEMYEELEDSIAQIDISAICDEAEILYGNKEYISAKMKYTEALCITPNNKSEYIKDKINGIEKLIEFLQKRAYTYYDYNTINPSDYTNKKTYLENELNIRLQASDENLTQTRVRIICTIDTLNNCTTDYSTMPENETLNQIIEGILKGMKLEPYVINGYTAMAKAEFSFIVKRERLTIKVKKTPFEIASKDQNFSLIEKSIRQELNNAPIGRYTLDMNMTSINGNTVDDNRLIKVHPIYGASNAWLSLLVPGLGDHRVSFGKRKGIGIGLATYAIIGTGIGLKVYSNKEYKMYHNATEQAQMDAHYNIANAANKLFYTCIFAAGVTWIYDIIWVACKGSENAKETKQYRKYHLSAYYNNEFNANGVSIVLNF